MLCNRAGILPGASLPVHVRLRVAGIHWRTASRRHIAGLACPHTCANVCRAFHCTSIWSGDQPHTASDQPYTSTCESRPSGNGRHLHPQHEHTRRFRQSNPRALCTLPLRYRGLTVARCARHDKVTVALQSRWHFAGRHPPRPRAITFGGDSLTHCLTPTYCWARLPAHVR